MKEEVKKEAVKEEKKVAPKKTTAPKAEKEAAEQPAKAATKQVDPYVQVVNAIVNNEEFRKSIVDLLNVRTVLATKLSEDAANACVNIINSNNARIAKVVTNIIFNI